MKSGKMEMRSYLLSYTVLAGVSRLRGQKIKKNRRAHIRMDMTLKVGMVLLFFIICCFKIGFSNFSIRTHALWAQMCVLPVCKKSRVHGM